MKATIKICKAGKFLQSDIDVMRRITDVLRAHNLSVSVEIKEKKIIPLSKLKLKAV